MIKPLFIISILVSITFITLYIISPIIKKHKIKNDLISIYTSPQNYMTTDMANCLANKQYNNSDLETLSSTLGSICMAQPDTQPEICNKYTSIMENLDEWSSDCGVY